MAKSTASGGGAPAVMKLTCWVRAGFSASGVASSVLITMGAPHIWLTLCASISDHIAAPRTARRQTWVPASAVMVQGKHQPLQWNIGSVQR